MEINITNFFNKETPADYSASVAELGKDAGRITWAYALEYAEESLLLTVGNIPEFLEYVHGFGVWEPKETSKWTLQECNALLVQMISGDIREFCGDVWDWEEYEQGVRDGLYVGNLYQCECKQVYYYIYK